jgi:hypothetical protein
VCSTTFAVAAKVIGVVTTSSPGPIPSATSAACSPAVHEFSASAAGAPVKQRNSRSNSSVRGPAESHPERSVSVTAAISSSPMLGREKGRNPARRKPGGASAAQGSARGGGGFVSSRREGGTDDLQWEDEPLRAAR